MSVGPRDRSGATGFGFNPLDRQSGRREDASFVHALEARADARVLLLNADQVLFRPDGETADPVFDQGEAMRWGAGAASIFLGVDDGGAGWFARQVADLPPEGAPVRAEGLRSLASRAALSVSLMGSIASAKSVLDWHRRHGFCANCGAATAVVAAGWRRECPSCGVQHFPRVDPVVIMLAVWRERCLLGRQTPWPPGMYSALAGFLEPGETIEDAVRREVMEEAGVPCGAVRYHAAQPWPFPSQLMIGCFAEALSEPVTVDRTELENARWFSREEVSAMLAGRHIEGLTAPLPFAIANELMTSFVDGVGFES